MENYFASQRDHIFKNVEVLIYVFDVESRDVEKDMHYYQSCLEAIMTNSKDAKIFCLIHKMDLVQEDQRDKIYNERVQELQTRSLPLQVIPFRTSIWDETLYKVMSEKEERRQCQRDACLFRKILTSFCSLFLGLVIHCLLAYPQCAIAGESSGQLLQDLRGRRDCAVRKNDIPGYCTFDTSGQR